MIAALTLSLGWCIVPVGCAVICALYAYAESSRVSSGWKLAVWVAYLVPALVIAVLYLLAALLFGIR